MKNSPITIANITIHPGERITLALPTPEIYTCAPIYIPIHVIHGKKSGPTLLVCGSIHGDEINGVAIIQKLLNFKFLNSIRGTLIVIPTMNIYGMMTLSRNLPDQRDLDGSFPGSKSGSFASRLAYVLSEEIFKHISYCIDLHTGQPHISKFPQVKTWLDSVPSKELAQYFQAPVILNTESKEGLLWLIHREENPIPTMIYETGEALRLDPEGIKVGVRGIVHAMKNIEMLPINMKDPKGPTPVFIESDYWVRASSSGLCEVFPKNGAFVKKGTRIAKIYDPFGTEQKEEIFAPFDGIVIAKNNLPILNEGEPILQLVKIQELSAEKIKEWSEEEKKEVSVD